MATPSSPSTMLWVDGDGYWDGERLITCLRDLNARVEALEAAQREPEPVDKEENERRFKACMAAIDGATPEQIRAVTPEPAPAPTDDELLELCWRDNTLLSEDLRCAYDLGREHGAAAARCPHIRSSDEGTSYCALAEKTAATQAFWFVAFAPAGELVERVADAIYRNGIGDGFREEARAAIREVAKWLREAHGWEEGAQGLEREVNQ